jgi:hypothetical protein
MSALLDNALREYNRHTGSWCAATTEEHMTLNVTVLTPSIIYQSADFRLTDPTTGRPMTVPSSKTVTLTFTSWIGFITYTGVGQWFGSDRSKLIDVSILIQEWLTGTPPDLSIHDAAKIVQDKGTRFLQQIRPRRKHTFTLAGFDGDTARVYVISNFEDCYGNSRASPDADLAVTTRALGRGKKAAVIVTGYKDTVSVEERRLLGSLAANYPNDGLRIRRHMAALNESAARRSNDWISPGCVVLSFNIDSTSAMQLSGETSETPLQFPHIDMGMDTNKAMSEALKTLGVDTSRMRTVQLGYASSERQSRSIVTSAQPCRYTIVEPDLASGYSLIEITSLDFELVSARAVSDHGQVIGTGRPSRLQPHSIPWSWQDGQLDRLKFSGLAQAVDETGQIAAVLQDTGRQRAAIYRGGALIELPLYHGQPGVFEGTDSSAFAINSNHIVAGNVRSQTEEQGRPNERAAIFRDRQPTIALEGVPTQFGTKAVDINNRDHVLVVASPAVFDARSILWNPSDGSWNYVGDTTTNVFPIALNDDDIVLGQGRNIHTEPVAVMSIPGSGWARLGTDDGWAPVGINNQQEIIGRAGIDQLGRPWLRRPTGEIVLLSYLSDHHTTPTSINNRGQIVGGASTDTCSHAVIWKPRK